MAGVRFDAHYSVTSVDPPPLLKFIKENYPDVTFDIPHDRNGKPVTMWNLIAKKTLPPTRMVRYCCSELKEANGKHRVTVTGVRWAESPKRRNSHGLVDMHTRSKKLIDMALTENESASLNKRGGLIMNDDNDESRRMVEQCYRTRKTIVNPIIDWEEDEVWEFLNNVAKVPHCSLYDEGYTRLGCIGCPLQGSKGMREDFERYPEFKELYLRAIERMIQNHPGKIKLLDEFHESAENVSYLFTGEAEREREREYRTQAITVMKNWLTLDGYRRKSYSTGGVPTPENISKIA